MDIHHVNVKLLVKDPESLDMEALAPIFHNWIREQVWEERLLDVADYRHVFAGPGVILIGLEGDYSVDNTDSRLGVRYNRKAVFGANNQERLTQATRAALKACQRLEAETDLAGKLRFNGQDVEVSINDRLLVPNSEEARQALSFDFQSFGHRLFGETEFAVRHSTDPRRLFTAFLRSARPVGVSNLLANLVG
jgi:hypothetical protein